MIYYTLGLIALCLGWSVCALLIFRKGYKQHMLFIAASITFFIACIIYRRYLIGHTPIMYSVSDGFSQFLPIYKDFVRTLQDGNGLTFWNFSNGFGAIQSYLRFFYPTNLIPILAGTFINEQALMITVAWMQILKMVLATVFMFLFLKKFKFNDFICCNMGIIYAFCGILILRGHWWILGDECYLAMFILWAVECFFQDKKWYFIPVSIALLASCLGVYYIYLYAIELFIYGTVRYLYDKGSLKGYLKFIFTCGGLFLLGVLMMSGLLADSARVMLDTARYSATTDYAKTFALFEYVDSKVLFSAVLSLFDINTNGVFHMYTGALNYLERPIFYCGLGCLFFIPQGLILGEKRTKRFIIFGLLLAGLYMIFPVFTDIFNLFIKNEELGLRSYRLSSLWIVIMMIVVAAYGLHCSMKNGCFSKKGIFCTGLSLIVIFGFCLLAAPQNGVTIDYNVCRWVVLFLIVWSSFLILLNWKTEHRLIKVGTFLVMICISIAEMGHSARTTINVSSVVASEFYDFMQNDALGYYGDVPMAVDYIKNYDDGLYRVAGLRTGLSPYCAPLYFGIYDSSYYANINSKTYEFLNEVYPESFLANLGTKYSVGVGADLYLSTLTGYKYLLKAVDSDYEVPYGYELLHTIGDINIYENRLNLSIGITYDSYIKKSCFEKYSEEDQRKIMLYCTVLDDDTDVGLREVSSHELDSMLLKEKYSSYENNVSHRAADKFSIQSWKEDYIVGNIRVTKDSFIVFSIPHVQGWDIYIDGVKTDIETANIGFIAVPLTEGQHRIELRYLPKTLIPSAVLSILTAIIYLILVIKNVRGSQVKNEKI